MVYIYLIEANIKDTVQYKIGISKHPDKRILELKTANPNIVGIINRYKVKNRFYANKIETLLHKTYIINKISGEWFYSDSIPKEFLTKCQLFEKNIEIYEKLQKNIYEDYS